MADPKAGRWITRPTPGALGSFPASFHAYGPLTTAPQRPRSRSSVPARGSRLSACLTALRHYGTNVLSRALRQDSATPGSQAPRNPALALLRCLLAPGRSAGTELPPAFRNLRPQCLPAPACPAGSSGFKWLPQLQAPRARLKGRPEPTLARAAGSPHGPQAASSVPGSRWAPANPVLGFGGFLSFRLPESP